MTDPWIAAALALGLSIVLAQLAATALLIRRLGRPAADLAGPASSERLPAALPTVDPGPVRGLDRALRAEVRGLSGGAVSAKGDWQFDFAAAVAQLEQALERCAEAEERYSRLEDRGEGLIAELSAAAHTLADSVAQQLSAARADLDLAVRQLNNQRQLQDLRFEQLAGDLQVLLRELRTTRPAPASCQVRTLRPPPPSSHS